MGLLIVFWMVLQGTILGCHYYIYIFFRNWKNKFNHISIIYVSYLAIVGTLMIIEGVKEKDGQA